jgi:hypothetical protein
MHLVIVVVSAACIEGTAMVVCGRSVCFIIGWVGAACSRFVGQSWMYTVD